MKEKYVKPAIYLESFALSQSIAKFCEAGIRSGKWYGAPLMWSESNCGWDTYGGQVLFHGSSPCTWDMDKNSWEGICYNNPNDSTPLFAS